MDLNYLRKSQDRNIIIIIILFFLIKVLFLFKFHEFFWDESVYIGMGKYIFSSGSVGIWESIRPPVLPLIFGSIWWLGLDMAWFGGLVMILFSCGVIFLSYRIAAELFSRKIALLSAFLLAFTPLFFKYSSLFLTGIPSSFFALLALYLYIRKKSLFLVGLFASLSMLTRFPQGIIVFTIGMLIIFDYLLENKKVNLLKGKSVNIRILSRNLTGFASGVLCPLVIFLISNFFMYKDVTSGMVDAFFRPFLLAFEHSSNVHESVGGVFYNLFFYFIELFLENYLFIFFLIGIVLILSKRYRYKSSLLLIPLFLYLIYFTSIINKQARFSLVFLSFIAILAAYAIMEIIRFALKSRLKHIIFLVLISSIIFSYGMIIREDWMIYQLMPECPPEIMEFYHDIEDCQEPILTSDPTSLAYIDKLMIAYYQDNIAGPEIYEKNKLSAGTIIFHPEVYPCIDDDCSERSRQFFSKLKSNHILMDERVYYGMKYYIFI